MATVPSLPSLLAAPFSGSEIVSYADSTVGEPMEQKLARLRSDREAHSRKQIWTKDAHGGPYEKVNMGRGIDPLTQLPDGRQRQADLGYERVKVGPTSNFVGNHMTQGAIDLVQAQLELPEGPDLRRLGGIAAAHQAPRLLPQPAQEEGGSGASATPVLRPLQRYQWTDAGTTVMVEVPVQQMELGSSCNASGSATLTCTFQRNALDLLVVVGAVQPGTDVNAGKGGETSKSSKTTSYRLLVRPLLATVVPERCTCYVKGALALPACGSQPNSSSNGVGKHAHAACSAAAGSDVVLPTAQQGRQEQVERSVCFRLPPGAEAVVVQLAKADGHLRWEALQASLTFVPLANTNNGPTNSQPDLAALRRAVRQKLKRASTAEARTGDATSAKVVEEAQQAATGSLGNPQALQELLCKVEALVAAGQYAQALDVSNACLTATASASVPAMGVHDGVRMHALRGRSHGQLGALKQAIAEYSAAIQLALSGHEDLQHRQAEGGQQVLIQLLLERAALYEQQEQLQAALADVNEAVRLQPQPAPPVLMTAQRLKQACRRSVAAAGP